ncbi:MAG: hypothetical protein WBL61_10410, partial [Bryobacteraceae bacterium]
MRKLLVISSLWLLAVSAQQGVPQGGSNSSGAPRSTVTFSTTRQLVVEDVIVKSQNGKPVDNLKAGDFLVTEDGKPQQIGVFEFQKLSEEAVPAPPPALQQRTEVA